MKNARRLILASAALVLLFMYTSRAVAQDCAECEDGTSVQVAFIAVNGSGISGTATLCVKANGVRGQIRAHNLTAGNAYTVWFFFAEGGISSAPGRFDSTVARKSTAIFSGHVGGLHAPSGSMITLLMFDHGMVNSDDVTLANNLLTPTGGTAAAQAVFTIP